MQKENAEKNAKAAHQARLKIEAQNKKILDGSNLKVLEQVIKNMLLPSDKCVFQGLHATPVPRSYCVEPQPISTWKMESTFSSFPWQHQV